jgi:hypothetical protein
VAPAVGAFCLSIPLGLTGTLFGPFGSIGIVPKGLFESIGAVCLGYFAYECVVRFKEVRLTDAGRRLLGLVELGCYVLGVAMMLLWSEIYTGPLVGRFSQGWYELAICVLLFIGAVLTCSGKTSIAFDVSGHPFLMKASSVLAMSSLVLYLTNYYQIYYVCKIMKSTSLEETLPYILVLVAVSFLVTYFGGKYLVKAGGLLKSKLVVAEEESTE